MPSYTDYANYGVDPWDGITTNERTWYDPLLRDRYRRAAVYSPTVRYKFDLGGPRARTIVFNDLIPPRANIAPLSARATEASRLYTDSYQKEVRTERYGNGFSFHRESDMFNYWEANGAVAGMMYVINSYLGQVITDHMDYLARNEYFRHPYPFFGTGSATGFGGLSTSTDRLTTDLVDGMWLSMGDRLKYGAPAPVYNANISPTGNEPVCITTRGAIYDLKREVGTGTGGLNFVDVNKYSERGREVLITGELGMYRGIRFVDSPMAKLWNVGTISHQTTIKAAVKPGDGAPDPETTKVEGTMKVGQPGATHHITVNDASGFSVGDMVAIHLLRHDATSLANYGNKGVLNGVRFDDPMLQNVEIHSIDTSGGTGNHKITFKEPYMMVDQTSAKGLETDLGGSVFGYVTKAVHVHTALFLPPEMSVPGIVAGIAQPVRLYNPRPFDDYESIYRVAYDFWGKFQLWDARAFDLVFLTGANALIGRRVFH